MAESLRRSEVVDVKRLAVRELVEGGYLQEVNRRLLHPLGLALEVERAAEPTRVLLLRERDVARLRILAEIVVAHDPSQTEAMAALSQLLEEAELLQVGDARLSGVWDCRDDPEGIIFDPGLIDRDKTASVTDELNLRSLARQATLGYIVQPVVEHHPEEA